MNFIHRYKILIFSAATVLMCAGENVAVNAQTYLETFGQNRIQYRKFGWKYFDTKHFRIYHYDAAGRQLARYVSEEAENDISALEKELGGQFPKRFNIILYNNYDEYKQTNIGLQYDGQIQDAGHTGSLNLVGDKLVVYFTGEHVDLRRQIRAGIAQTVMQRMMFGENLRQMVKNSVSMNLPLWTTEGFIAYVVDGWDTKTNSDWKNLLDDKPTKGFFDLSEEQPELAGKAFWRFMDEHYGRSYIKRLLYAMQEKNSLNQGTKKILGLKVTQVYDSCIAFYKVIYAADAQKANVPDTNKNLLTIDVPNDNTIIRNIRVSPRGEDVAYVTWKDGEYKVFIQHTQNEKLSAPILEGGMKDYNEAPDPNYPLLAWSNNGYKLAILYKKGTQTRLRIYNSFKARVENYIIPPNRFDRVLGLTFMEDDDNIVFSAIKKSQTDLYEFRIRGSRMTNITNDPWDDLQPWFVSGGTRRGILFLSNRPQPNLNVPIQVNELPTGPMNVFFYDTKTRRSELLQCSHVSSGNVSQPIQYGSENFAYLYDANGIRNEYVVLFARDRSNHDSAYAVPVTNYPSNIISHQYNPASNQAATVVQVGNKYIVYYNKLNIPQPNAVPVNLQPITLMTVKKEDSTKAAANESLFQQQYQQQHQRHSKRHNRNATTTDNTTSNEPLVKGGNAFQSEFIDTAQNTTHNAPANAPAIIEVKTPELDSTVLTEINDSSYMKMRAAPYRLSFKPDFFTVRVDNSILFNQYQSFNNNGGAYTNPSLGGLITLSLNDLMENHRFTGGFQLPVNFAGTTYFLQYENFEHRIDWSFLYLRTESYFNYLITYVDNAGQPVLQKDQLGKAITNMVQAGASYPLDHNRSIKFRTALREDVMRLKAIDTLSLLYDVPNNKQYWSLSRLEYVFDNTTSPFLNIRYGFRYKFYGEYLYELNNGNRNCYNLGTDIRYYHKIYKNFIWATRFAAEHSDGNSKVVFYLGGVDNWIGAKYDDYVPINGGPYSFQSLATNLRGYNQNARNGNTYALINTEFRLPILTTFMKRPIQSSILKNLQAVAFLDAGSAWNGILPTQDNGAGNYLYPTPGTPNPGMVNLNLSAPNSGGIACGYGLGLRTLLLGYFLKVDAAWNVDGARKPIWYVSIGTDF
ncbi:MAG: hypothetical protein ACTHJ0_09290 [Flavipsychrobacter sp.]